MKVRAVSMRWWRTRSEVSTTPPCDPSALDSVAVTTTFSCRVSPSSSTSPRPPAPRTPSPWASSTSRTAPYPSHAACNAVSGARSPSALYTESVTTSARSSDRPASARSTAATSPRSTTTTRARDNLHASTSEACEPPSETISDPRPDSATTAPRLAVYPEENTSAEGRPVKPASSSSSSLWSVVVPVTSRDPVAPAPQRRVAAIAPSSTSGWVPRPR